MLLLLAGCAPPTLQAELRVEPSAVVIRANLPLDAAELIDGRGAPVVRDERVPPARSIVLRAPLPPGPYTVHLRAGDQRRHLPLQIADPGPARIQIQAPLGQSEVAPGSTLELPDGAPVRVGIVVEAVRELTLAGPLVDRPRRLVAGERAVLVTTVGPAGLSTWIAIDGRRRSISLETRSVPLAQLQERLVVEGPYLPAGADGEPDPTLPPNQIRLPAPWWDRLLDRLGLGFRPRDDLAPRTHVGVHLHNRSERPLHLVLSATVEVDGRPHPAFRPRIRDATDLHEVRRIVRVPRGETVTVALPIYLDRRAVGPGLSGTVVVEILSLGSDRPLHTSRAPIAVHRGHPWASAIFIIGLAGSLTGWSLVALRLRGWTARPTSVLATVAVFGSLLFTIGAASQSIGLGIASALGPFAPFILGLVDATARICLLATLLQLAPQPGVLGLTLLVGWLLRALTLGAVHPVELLYVGASVATHESLALLAGLTRGRFSFARLWVTLVLPSAALSAYGLAISAVLYRLYYADLYAASLVLVPGLLYPTIGCWLALPFARSLRRVAP